MQLKIVKIKYSKKKFLKSTTTVKWKFLVSLETQLCHVMFFWKSSCERMFCWSRRVRGCFCWSRYERRHVMFGKSISRTQQTVVGFTLQDFACLCLSACLHTEKSSQERLVAFWLLLATFSDLCWFGGASKFFLDQTSTTDSCLVLGNWTGLPLLICI